MFMGKQINVACVRNKNPVYFDFFFVAMFRRRELYIALNQIFASGTLLGSIFVRAVWNNF